MPRCLVCDSEYEAFNLFGPMHLANATDAHRARGIRTITQFFDEALAEPIVKTDRHVDAAPAANVMDHIPYQHSLASGTLRPLAPKAVLIFEDPSPSDIAEKTSYDQIYDEDA